MVLRLITLPLSYLRALFFIINTFVVAIVHSLIMIPIYPVRLVFPQLYVTIESFLYAKAGESLIPAFGLIPRLKLYADTIDEIEPLSRKRAMVIVNHQDTGDVPVMMSLLTYYNISHTSTWILDRMFRWTQFGVVSQWHCDFASQEGRNTRISVAEEIREHFSTTYFDKGRKWLVFFPEGGFLKNRGESARRYAAKNNLPILYNCCLPRTTAFINVAKAMRGEVHPLEETVEDIIDVTIGYKGSTELSVLDYVFGTHSDKEVYMNFRTYKMSDLPQSDEDLTTWLYDRYVEKEELLKNFKAEGRFVDNKEFTRIQMPTGRILGSLIFWYISAFFVYDFYKCSLNTLLSLAFRMYS